jgi:Secretion system C-terminal sorting domain
MKKITTLAFAILSISLIGQPILNASDINPLNVSANRFIANNTNVAVGATGANQTWNFSGLTLISSGAGSSISVSTAPYASSFPTTNFFVNSISNSNSSYGYYNLTNNKLETVGISNDSGIVVTFTNPQTIFEFPFVYNQVINDTFTINTDPTINTISSKYDAYGTLTNAFGTFNSVFRIKQVNGLTGYVWIKLNPYQELMSAIVNANGTISYTVNQSTVLSNYQNVYENQFSIFPNPTSGNFSIKNNLFENETFLNVFDILGNKIISNEKIDNNSKEIDLSNFASGMYFVKISDVNNNILQTEKIIKK